MAAHVKEQKTLNDKENVGSSKIFTRQNRTIPLRRAHDPAKMLVSQRTMKANITEPELVRQIACASSFEEVMNYLRNNFSDRNLGLTMEAIKINPQNFWVFQARRHMLRKIKSNLHEEYEYFSSLPVDDEHIWTHRVWIAERLDTRTMRREFERAKRSIVVNPNKDTYWLTMERLSVNLGTIVIPDELSLTSDVLSADEENTCAWDYKCMVALKLGVTASQLKDEVKFVKKIIRKSTKHEYAWAYLRELARKLSADTMGDVLKFVKKILSDDAENSFAWTYRKRVAETRNDILSEEFKFTYEFISEKPNNNSAWCYRRWLFDRFGDNDANEEMSFTGMILCEDVKNDFAWYHRRWLLSAFGGWEEELAYCDQLLEVDINNDCAWSQRSFVVMRDSMGVLDDLRINEVKYAKRIIFTTPGNSYAWIYLQGLYLKSDFDDSTLDDIFEFVLSDDIFSVMGVQENIIRNTRSYVNALEALPYLLCCGYKPSRKIAALIYDLCSISGLSDEYSPIMQFLDKLRLCNCEWLTEMTDGLDYARIMEDAIASQ